MLLLYGKLTQLEEEMPMSSYRYSHEDCFVLSVSESRCKKFNLSFPKTQTMSAGKLQYKYYPRPTQGHSRSSKAQSLSLAVPSFPGIWARSHSLCRHSCAADLHISSSYKVVLFFHRFSSLFLYHC